VDGLWDDLVNVVADEFAQAELELILIHEAAFGVVIGGSEAVLLLKAIEEGGSAVDEVLEGSSKAIELDNELMEELSSDFRNDPQGHFEHNERLGPLFGRYPPSNSPPFPPPYRGGILVTSSGQITGAAGQPLTNAGTMTVAATPEPKSVVLLASGLLFIGAMSRRARAGLRARRPSPS
jgi:hypothetical protein